MPASSVAETEHRLVAVLVKTHQVAETYGAGKPQPSLEPEEPTPPATLGTRGCRLRFWWSFAGRRTTRLIRDRLGTVWLVSRSF